MSDDPIPLRSGGYAWYEGELSPPAELDRAMRDLRDRREALERDPENEQLHDRCFHKVLHLLHLTARLPLDPEIADGARGHLIETLDWLDALPVARIRRGA
jgi:hypothetical protein